MPDIEVTVFGEVLFDHFPNGSKVLGGAPFNVAWHLQAFGRRPLFVSRIGDDEDGREILAAMQDWGMATTGIQLDPERTTGRVAVALEDGQPSYDIVHPCAYDAIEPSTIDGTGLLYHGSLALRDAPSRAALDALVADPDTAVFLDVNLRDPWWDKQVLSARLERASWVKLNQDELALLGPTGGIDDEAAAAMFDRYGLRGLIVTHGERGAVMMTPGEGVVRIAPPPGTRVVDTVGAGDAFAAVCIVGLLQAWPTDVMLQRAQSFAALIVAQQGATARDRSLYAPLIAQWNLDS
jgi:fructokinase